jgi:hypothetical protein
LWFLRKVVIRSEGNKIVLSPGTSYQYFWAAMRGFAIGRRPEIFGAKRVSFWWFAPKPEPYAESNFLAKEFVKSPKLPLQF